MAEFDLPAIIDYILRTTNTTKLSYIGHSQGVEIALALLSRFPEYQKKVNIAVGLSPVARMTNVKGMLRLLSNIIKTPEVSWISYNCACQTVKGYKITNLQCVQVIPYKIHK